MKAFALLLVLVSSVTNAAPTKILIKEAWLDANEESITITFDYYHGCVSHFFALSTIEEEDCTGTFLRKCSARIVEFKLPNRQQLIAGCNGFKEASVTTNLRQAKLDSSTFSGATILIKGDRDDAGNSTSAKVILPQSP